MANIDDELHDLEMNLLSRSCRSLGFNQIQLKQLCKAKLTGGFMDLTHFLKIMKEKMVRYVLSTGRLSILKLRVRFATLG